MDLAAHQRALLQLIESGSLPDAAAGDPYLREVAELGRAARRARDRAAVGGLRRPALVPADRCRARPRRPLRRGGLRRPVRRRQRVRGVAEHAVPGGGRDPRGRARRPRSRASSWRCRPSGAATRAGTRSSGTGIPLPSSRGCWRAAGSPRRRRAAATASSSRPSCPGSSPSSGWTQRARFPDGSDQAARRRRRPAVRNTKASTSATATKKSSGIWWPISTSRYSARASGGLDRIGMSFSSAIRRIAWATRSAPLATTSGAGFLPSYLSATAKWVGLVTMTSASRDGGHHALARGLHLAAPHGPADLGRDLGLLVLLSSRPASTSSSSCRRCASARSSRSPR